MSINLNTDELLVAVANIDRRAARQYQRIVHQVANEMATFVAETLNIDCAPARRIAARTLVPFDPKGPTDPCPEALVDFAASGGWGEISPSSSLPVDVRAGASRS